VQLLLRIPGGTRLRPGSGRPALVGSVGPRVEPVLEVYPGIPESPITAVTVPRDRFTLGGHELVIVEVGHSDTDDTTVLHVPDLDLVVAGDVIYNGAHAYVGESVLVDGLDPWRAAIEKVEALAPRHIVGGHY
jgi:glyoxylase-like metal-dependent hydrolase (beta-lactamase superfamily II)